MKIWMISFCGGLGHVREYICNVYLTLMKGAQMLACFASKRLCRNLLTLCISFCFLHSAPAFF